MNESSGTAIPDPDPMSSSRSAGARREAEENGEDASLPPAYRDVVQRLRNKVERAAVLLERLHTENVQLRQRVDELEQRPEVPDGNTVLGLEDDPDLLRDRISTFIDAIDTYLEDIAPEASQTDASTSDGAES